jgi:hypothetical protein
VQGAEIMSGRDGDRISEAIILVGSVTCLVSDVLNGELHGGGTWGDGELELVIQGR